MRPWVERAVIVGGAGYLLVTGWAMTHLRYDLWGALLIIPVIIAVTPAMLRRAFGREHPELIPILLGGLLVKLVGCFVRYQVAFEAYGGASDAQQYHEAGAILAEKIRSGQSTLFAAVPRETGTAFIKTLTGDIYAIFGSSRLAGFMIFGFFGYWGALYFLRAAMVAVPGLHVRRYAVLLCFLPTMVYWPSSIGKEAWMCLSLGYATYGGAQILVGGVRARAVVTTIVGLIGASFVRPHFGVIWAGALVAGLIAGLFSGVGNRGRQSRSAIFVLVLVAVAGLSLVAAVTLKFLSPKNDDGTTTTVTDRISEIFDKAEVNTDQGGSSFTVIPIDSPRDMPYAIYRTLTRPLLNEARSFAELLPAVEMTALLAWGLFAWRRLWMFVRTLVRTPYLMFCVVVFVMFGVAFTSIGNLGILTRQRSLVMPLFVVPLCLPIWRGRTDPTADGVLQGADERGRPVAVTGRG